VVDLWKENPEITMENVVLAKIINNGIDLSFILHYVSYLRKLIFKLWSSKLYHLGKFYGI
jgi:hypothetical protein